MRDLVTPAERVFPREIPEGADDDDDGIDELGVGGRLEGRLAGTKEP